MRRISIIQLWLLVTLCAASAATSGPGELAVTAVEPAAHSLGAAADTSITIHFDRPVAAASVGPLSFSAFGRWSGAVSGSYAFSEGGATVSLTPARPFSAGESVMVVLSHDLEAVDGGMLRGAGYSSQFWVRALPAGLDFAALDILDTGSPSRPYGGIASDLDGDGYLDITTVNEDTDDLRVFMNDGSGSFSDFLQPTFGTGNTPSPSEPADFDRDGNVDVVVANTQTTSVSILLGNGDGTFGPQQEIQVSGRPRGVTVLDVDGDGDLDVAATGRTTHMVTVLLNDGAGVFGNATFFGTGTAEEWAIAAGDMNGDGIFDLVVGGQTAQRIYVYAGQGDGTFALIDDGPSGGRTWMLVLGDVNGDGNLDVSAGNGISNNGAILFGDGAGGIGAPQTYPADPTALATDLGDLDGDGDLDWMLASFGGDWTLLTNDGTGAFTFDREVDAPAAASCSLMMDIDNDGDLDLALFDELADVVLLLENLGTTLFTDGFESGDTLAWSSTVGL